MCEALLATLCSNTGPLEASHCQLSIRRYPQTSNIEVRRTHGYLHWLPVRSRIVLKILLLVYKTLNGNGSDYLASMLRYSNVTHVPSHYEPTTLSKYGDRAFSRIGPSLWNRLPADIKKFSTPEILKIAVKTNLFKEAYNIAWSKYFELQWFVGLHPNLYLSSMFVILTSTIEFCIFTQVFTF